jgi:hypothetical protein
MKSAGETSHEIRFNQRRSVRWHAIVRHCGERYFPPNVVTLGSCRTATFFAPQEMADHQDTKAVYAFSSTELLARLVSGCLLDMFLLRFRVLTSSGSSMERSLT